MKKIQPEAKKEAKRTEKPLDHFPVGDEALDLVFNTASKVAEEWITRKETVPATIVAMFEAEDGKYPTDFQVLPEGGQEERQHFILDLARGYAGSKTKPLMFVFMAEAWSLKIKKEDLDSLTSSPSEHPDRVETLIVSAMDERGRQKMMSYEIKETDGERLIFPMSFDEEAEETKMGVWVEMKDKNNPAFGFHDLALESLWAEYRILKSLYSFRDNAVE